MRALFRWKRRQSDAAVQPVLDRCSAGTLRLFLSRRAPGDPRRGRGAHDGRRWWIARPALREGWHFGTIYGGSSTRHSRASGVAPQRWEQAALSATSPQCLEETRESAISASDDAFRQDEAPEQVPYVGCWSCYCRSTKQEFPEANLLEMQRLLGNPKGKATKIQDMNPSVQPDPISEDEDEGLRAAQEAEGFWIGSGIGPNAAGCGEADIDRADADPGQAEEGLSLEDRSSPGRCDHFISGFFFWPRLREEECSGEEDTSQHLQRPPRRGVTGGGEIGCSRDLNSQTLGPGQAPRGLNARAWVEFRSRIGNYKTSAHSSWSAAGVLDSLISGDIPKARARCALLLLQLDQASIDRGKLELSCRVISWSRDPRSVRWRPTLHQRWPTAKCRTAAF